MTIKGISMFQAPATPGVATTFPANNLPGGTELKSVFNITAPSNTPLANVLEPFSPNLDQVVYTTGAYAGNFFLLVW